MIREKKVAHIISHTHWDREWYLNSEYTNEWLPEFFKRLFEILEKEKEYTFVLDGQTAMIEDYFDQLKKQGEGVLDYKEKIKKYVKERRLFIGPYYIQLDWNLVSDEALIRNLLIGNKISRELGGTMKVGWLLDNFGQISQTAQIHNGFGVKGLYVWRGIEISSENMKSEFLWESPDGTRLPSVYLIDSYRNAMRLAEYRNILRERIYDEVDKLKPFATTPNILLMNGYDQEMAPDYFSPYIINGQLDTDELKIIPSNPEKYMEELIQYRPRLNIMKGALYSGRFIAVFPGVLSSRMYLKLQSYQCLKLLERYAEPLSIIIWSLGGEYEAGILETVWKKLLKYFSHDNICGVCIDDVCSDMEENFREVLQLTNNLIESRVKELTCLIDTSGGNKSEAFVLFNPSVYMRNEVVSINGKDWLVKDIPPLGYKVIRSENKDEVEKPIKVMGNLIENGKIKVNILDDGSFDLTNKTSGRVYKGLGVIEDSGDAGDEYDYSYPDIDNIITSKGKKAEIKFVEKSDVRVVVKIKTVLKVPEALTKDRKKRNSSIRKLPVATYLTIDADSSYIKCRTEVKNTVKDHRMRILFPTNIDTKTSFTGSAFDIVKKTIYIEDYDNSPIPEEVERIIIGAREVKPNTIFPMKEFVDLYDQDGGIAVLSKGLTEYQIIPEKSTIALTLFRSVGWIATEINTRVGDAGPRILAPEAQCLRQMVFQYAVYVHQGSVFKGKVLRTADAFNTDLLVLKTTSHAGPLTGIHKFIEVEDIKQVLRVTTVKRSEDKKAIIIRCYNPSGERIIGKINSRFTVKEAYYTNLLEEIEGVVKKNNDHLVEIVVNPGQIATIRLEIQREKMVYLPTYPVEIMEKKIREDFSEYESVPLVTKEDVLNEEKRAEVLKLESKPDNPMMRRTALEAALSARLTYKKFIENEIRKLGYQINDARVKARVYNYIYKYINKSNKPGNKNQGSSI